MMDLQEKYRLTYIFVTHDLSVVKHISDDIMVMYLGVMVEKTSSEELFSRQLHPYTKALLSAIPIAKPNLDRKRIALKGELTSPIEPPKMCRFAPRCPYATLLPGGACARGGIAAAFCFLSPRKRNQPALRKRRMI